MASKSRRFQFVFAQENQPAVGVSTASLFTAANAKILPRETSLSYDPELINRVVIKPSLTPLTPLLGVVDCTAVVSFELTGDTASAEPAYSKLIQACGMRSVSITHFTIGAITVASPKAFHAGETVTFAVSGATAKVLFDTYDGETSIYLYDVSATPGNNVMTGGSSAAVATVSDSPGTAAGFAWVPTSESESSCTITGIAGTIAVGDVIQGDTSKALIVATRANWANGTVYFRYLDGTLTRSSNETVTNLSQTGSASITSATEVQVKNPTLTMSVIEDGNRKVIVGCRGKFTLAAQDVGEPIIVRCEFKGRLASTPNLDGVEVTGVTRTSHVPPGFKGVTYRIGKRTDLFAAEHTPRIRSFSIDYNKQAGVDKDATSASGQSGAAEHLDCEITGNMTVGIRPETVFGFLGLLTASGRFRQKMTVGSTNGNKFIVQIPACQPTKIPTEDADGFGVYSVEYSASGEAPNASEGDDRELMIAYQTA